MIISYDQRITARGIPMGLKVKDLAVLNFEVPLDRSSNPKEEVQSTIRALIWRMPVEGTRLRVCFADEGSEAHVRSWEGLPVGDLRKQAVNEATHLKGQERVIWDWTIQGWRERDLHFNGNAIFLAQSKERLAFLRDLLPFGPDALVPVEALCLEAGELCRKIYPHGTVCILYMGDKHTSLVFQGPKKSRLINASGGMNAFVEPLAKGWNLDPAVARTKLFQEDKDALDFVKARLERWAKWVVNGLEDFGNLPLCLLRTTPGLCTTGFVWNALRSQLWYVYGKSMEGVIDLQDSRDFGLQSNFDHLFLQPAKILAMQGFGGLHRMDLSQTQRNPLLGAGDISTGIVISNQGVTAVQVSLG